MSMVIVASWRWRGGGEPSPTALWLRTVTLGAGRVHPLARLYALSGGAIMSARLRIPKP